MNSRVCPICQEPALPPNAQYCPHCGSQLSTVTPARPIVKPSLWPVLPIVILALTGGMLLITGMQHDDWVFAVQKSPTIENPGRPFGRIIETVMPGARWQSNPIDRSHSRVTIEGRIRNNPDHVEIELLVFRSTRGAELEIIRSGVYIEGVPLKGREIDEFFSDLTALDREFWIP